MDDQFAPQRGMFACFPCWILVRWWRGTSENDPERQPLFPPPTTILTPPRRRRPNLPNLSSLSKSSHSILGSISGEYRSRGTQDIWNSAPVSPAKSTGGTFFPNALGTGTARLSNEGRERMGSISRAYGGRMQSLQPPPSGASTPSVPSTPGLSAGPGNEPRLRPLSAVRLDLTNSSNPSTTQDPDNSTRSLGQVPPPLPYPPSVPNLGRSASEPRNLSELSSLSHLTGMEGGRLDFAPHQIPSYGAISVGRGASRAGSAGGVRGTSQVRGRGRNRSATVTANSVLGVGAGPGAPTGLGWGQRESASTSPGETEGRGRSPGPALALRQDHEYQPGSDGTTRTKTVGKGRSGVNAVGKGANLGRSMSHPTLMLSEDTDHCEGPEYGGLATWRDAGTEGETVVRREDDEDDGEVVKRELGLRGLASLSNVRGGRKTRGGHREKGRVRGRGRGKAAPSDLL